VDHQEKPVGVISQTPAEGTATFAGLKQAALHQIEALLGQQVVIQVIEIGQLLQIFI
jgi:hypothetical protein